MNLFFYIPTEKIHTSALVRQIEESIPQFRIEIFKSTKDFKSKLNEPRYKFTVAIVLAPNRQDISDVLSLEHFLRDVQIILIISHENHGTLKMAHYLRPRFISYFSHFSKEIDTGQIMSVLQKMFENQVSSRYITKISPSI